MPDQKSAPHEDASGPASETKFMTDMVFAYLRSDIPVIDIKRHASTKPATIDDNNSYISKKVFERLLFRHAILERLEGIESDYNASKNYIYREPVSEGAQQEDNALSRDEDKLDEKQDKAKKKESKQTDKDARGSSHSETSSRQDKERLIESERALRAYRLAVTDLFVEKAISYLEQDYDVYVRDGKKLFVVGGLTIIASIVIAASALVAPWIIEFHKGMLKENGNNAIQALSNTQVWVTFLTGFVKSFTLFGFLVLLTVYCARLGKAMMDQAERLRERRHSLRQGRLFVHLNNGQASVDDLVKAFDWNVLKGNAFGNIPTEASAPWGSVIKEALKAIPQAFKEAKK